MTKPKQQWTQRSYFLTLHATSPIRPSSKIHATYYMHC